MAKSGKKPDRSGHKPAPKPKQRNPFAGRPRSGAGFHDEDRYGKKDRRRQKQEIEEDQDPTVEDTDSADR